MFEVKEHLLYQDGRLVEQHPSPNRSGPMEPTLVVMHYTGDNSYNGAVAWLVNPQSGVSAHLVVRKDGTVAQLLPFNIIGWHAGKSEYDGRPYVNQFSIGIENVGIGDDWPDAQIQTLKEIVAALYAAYPIEDTVGHEDVAPGRKVDPGPNFPWDKIVTREEA